jgi:hypothetical protein
MELLIGLFPVLVIGIPLILWIVMLVHAIKNDIEDKTLWLIILILGGLIGGIVYYITVYTEQNKKTFKDY